MWVLILIVSLVLAAIPANIAKSKGKDYATWYVYGFFLWIVAIIHAAALPYQQPIIVQNGTNTDLQNLKAEDSNLVAQGVISEFDIDCPVEPIEWTIYKNNGLNFCNVKFRNLLIGNIRAMKFQVLCLDAFGEPVQQIDNNISNGIIQDLDIPPEDLFGDGYFVKLHSDNVRSIKIIVSQVLFTDNKKWEKSNSDIVDMAIIPLKEQELEDLKIVAGDDARCYPNEIEKHWICVCGRYNEHNRDLCNRCGRGKNIVFDKFTKSSVENTIKKIELQKEGNERLRQIQLQEIKEKYSKIIKKYLVIGIPSISALMLSVFLYMIFVNPIIQYNNAIRLVDKQQYNKAISTFSKIVNYKDSKQQRSELIIKCSRNMISAGAFHTVGLKSNGTVVAVGDNKYGLCNVSDLNNIVSVSAGAFHTVGLKSNGTVVAVGDNQYGRCNVSDWNNIVSVSAGYYHTVGLKSDNTVVAVGNNEYGQCNVLGWIDIVAVSAGSRHTVGLKSDGTVVVVGNNEDGQCYVTNWKDIVSVSACVGHTVGIKSDGTVVVVGNNKDGECNVSGWKDIISVSAGAIHTVGLKSDGTVVAVGNNEYGQCNVSDWKDIVAVSAGGFHTVGLKRDGTIVAVGDISDGLNWTNIGQH